MLPLIHIGTMHLHPALGRLERCKTVLAIESMRVLRSQHPAAQPLEIGMSQDALHQPLGEAAAAVLGEHEDVRVPEDVALVAVAGEPARADRRLARGRSRAVEMEDRESRGTLQLLVGTRLLGRSAVLSANRVRRLRCGLPILHGWRTYECRCGESQDREEQHRKSRGERLRGHAKIVNAEKEIVATPSVLAFDER